MTHEEFEDMLALHALGGLEPADAEALEPHLATCSACAQTLAELRETAALLAYAADPVTPSPAVARRILAADHPASESPRLALVPTEARRPRRWVPRLSLGRVAVAAVIAFLVVSQVNLLNRLRDALEMLERTRSVGEFITSANVSVVPLWGRAPGTHAKLAYDRSTGRAVLFSTHLPPLPEGATYQLWLVSDRFRPAGAVSFDSPGNTSLHQRMPAAGESFVFAVTLDPPGGSEEPTGEMVLLSRSFREP